MQTDQFRFWRASRRSVLACSRKILKLIAATRVKSTISKNPAEMNSAGFLFWRRPTDSRIPIRSPAARTGLTIYVARRPPATSLTACGVPPRRASSRTYAKSPADSKPAGLPVLATSYSRTAYRRTTIGAAAFHCRVRNGNGWCHCAIVTRGPSRTGGFGASRRRGSLETMSILRSTIRATVIDRRDNIRFSKNCWFVDIYIQSV